MNPGQPTFRRVRRCDPFGRPYHGTNTIAAAVAKSIATNAHLVLPAGRINSPRLARADEWTVQRTPTPASRAAARNMPHDA